MASPVTAESHSPSVFVASTARAQSDANDDTLQKKRALISALSQPPEQKDSNAKTRSKTVTIVDYGNKKPRPTKSHAGARLHHQLSLNDGVTRRRGSFSGTSSSPTSTVHVRLPLPLGRSDSLHPRRRNNTLEKIEREHRVYGRTAVDMKNLTPGQSNMPDVTITRDDDGLDDVYGDAAGGKDQPERDTWGSKLQFFLTVIAYAVGLGNVWRLPYLCQQNGGGAFLIPYFIMLIVEGIPLFVLELGIGQKMRVGSISVWNKVHPLLGGLGIASAMVAFLVGIYYIVVCAWCVWYLYSSIPKSLHYELPWSYCPNDTITEHQSRHGLAANLTSLGPVSECTNTNATTTSYFWWRTTLDITDSIDHVGGVNWKIVLCFIFAWAAVFFTMFRGIKSSGKAMYFAALFPYLVLTIFFFRGITLKGAGAGLRHMFTPDVSYLFQPVVWLKAATQIFYSFGLGFGSLISFGSYNQPNANVKRDALYISAVNVFTGIFATTVVFSVLGYRAQHQYDYCIDQFFNNALALYPDRFAEFRYNQPQADNDFIHDKLRVEEYDKLSMQNFALNLTNNNVGGPRSTVDLRETMGDHFRAYNVCDLVRNLDASGEGTGLTFVVFAEAITKMPGAPFFAILFYSMLLSLGFGSMVGDLEGCISPIYDLQLFPWLKRYAVTGIVCLVSIAVGGVLFLTRSGQYWLVVFDDYSVSFSLTTIAFCEMVAISWIYGVDNFMDDIREMCGERLGWYWKLMWKYVGPLLMGTVILGSFYTTFIEGGFIYKRYVSEYSTTVTNTPYPLHVIVFICLLIAMGVLPIPLVALARKFGLQKFELSVADMNSALASTVSTQQMLTRRGAPTAAFDDDDQDDELGQAALAEKNRKGAAANRVTLDISNERNDAASKGYVYRFGQADRVHTESELSSSHLPP